METVCTGCLSPHRGCDQLLAAYSRNAGPGKMDKSYTNCFCSCSQTSASVQQTVPSTVWPWLCATGQCSCKTGGFSRWCEGTECHIQPAGFQLLGNNTEILETGSCWCSGAPQNHATKSHMEWLIQFRLLFPTYPTWSHHKNCPYTWKCSPYI